MANRGNDRKKPAPAEDRPTKRRRRYHLYTNGMLNVVPKGEKLEIAQMNAETSPLLRLPREIRDMIWKHVLQKDEYYAKKWRYGRRLFRPSVESGATGLPILGTCRQIYSEAVLFPYQGTTLHAEGYDLDIFVAAARKMKAAHRALITRVGIYVPWKPIIGGVYWMSWCLGDLKTIPLLFPGLRHIQIECPDGTDIDGNDEGKSRVDQVRGYIAHLQLRIPTATIEIVDHSKKLSERTKLAISGLL
ncbi:hypothetical protein DM02DRAFT_630302 [Periconia macrospinosa]|uniref:Uncharacterized protein n=1 Tax=Periconia macrospinosa TaxID=97972 RepID=A0A2V1DMJ1_9PLEO|nr:hypothetical protein DM02DRAFT_630302 [Periconia macrospinosa]